MKISIVSAYRNRKNLLINTLKSISRSQIKDIEYILVDDASNSEHRVEDLSEEFPFLKIIRIDEEDKWYTNPCIPFNIGIKNVSGDIVILQNPECYHNGDVLKYVYDNLTPNDYFSFGCFSLDYDNTINLSNGNNINLNNRGATYNGDNAWYNHTQYRPTGYHFTSAIHKENLDKLNGFDERYAYGVEYDDNEFLHRVKKFLSLKIIDSPFVFHQFHGNSSIIPNFHQLSTRNKNLYHNITLNEDKIKVNI